MSFKHLVFLLTYISSFLSILAQETQKAKQFLPFLQRAGRSEAVVEYVFSGSRLKLYMPKETCLITFLLAGKCQSASACQLRHHLWPHNDHNVAADRCCTTSLTLSILFSSLIFQGTGHRKNEICHNFHVPLGFFFPLLYNKGEV